MSTQQQRPDGGWEPAEPLPWFKVIDWEVAGRGRGRHAVAYWCANDVAHVEPGRFFRLRLWRMHRRLRRVPIRDSDPNVHKTLRRAVDWNGCTARPVPVPPSSTGRPR